MPERDTEPEEIGAVTADCGCEVYKNEYFYEWDGKTYCPDCMKDLINELPLNELVELAGGYATLNNGGADY